MWTLPDEPVADGVRVVTLPLGANLRPKLCVVALVILLHLFVSV